jgi:acyl carrier protein
MFAHRLDPVCSGGSNIQGEEDGSMHAEGIGRADTSTGAAEWSVEPRIRRVVVEHLGIGWEDLRPYVSLTEDLAADSLDLAELMVGLEDEFDIEIPDSMLGEVHSYAELVACVEALHRRRGAAARTEGERASAFVAVQIVPPADHATADLWRVCWCTPYNVETIVEDALSAGPGARLEARVLSEVSDAGLQSLEDRLAGLRERHIQVSIGRDQQLPIAPGATHPDAA